jgi:uncharacterized membrane protein YidH (DUF202 family)
MALEDIREGVLTASSIGYKVKAIGSIIGGVVLFIIGIGIMVALSALFGAIILLVGIIIFALGIWSFKNSRRTTEYRMTHRRHRRIRGH